MKLTVKSLLISFCAVFLLSACLLTEQPKTFDERYAVALVQLTEVRKAGTSALRAGSITVDDAKKLLKIEDEAIAVLDAALAAHDIADTATADNRLALAVTLLGSLQTYLRKESAR